MTPLSSCRKLHHNSLPEKHSTNVVDRRYVSTSLTSKMQTSSNDSILRPPKLLLKVTIENSLGAIQVLMLSEDTVEDLIKAALVFYEKEKRRPILKNYDPKSYDLHYSKFTFQSLKRDEKLLGLESRNFFLCSKPLVSSCTQKENMAMDSAFPWMVLVPFLL
ncbi:uncharacterized protein LOC131605822 [Vicia villosa]|uniref:uncharacterized protein LOC131605822 n=1 Tax=Vicia villosa TaxID=3911 RepID=UPI00273BAC95|nr:uncharacterized protein LOC131605822 [Vicia villosa]